MEFSHVSVLLFECLESLSIKENGIYIDGTAGGAGHSKEIAKRLSKGMLIALDQDPDAIKVATERLEGLSAKVIQSNFANMDKVISDLGLDEVDGILLDLGVSSFQLDNAERGFSYHADAQMDMRMSKQGATAADLINELSVTELTKIFYDYGEEKHAFRIAKRIEEKRKICRIDTTAQFVDIIRDCYSAKERKNGHPARKCFQAIRIAVNGELDNLEKALQTAFDCLKPGGRLCIITFHSLEDRMVKQFFTKMCKGCDCPPDLPICVCGKQPRAKMVPRKPIIPTNSEIENNKRSRSAKLRVLEKI